MTAQPAAEPFRIPTRRKILYLGFVLVGLLALGEGALRIRAWTKYGTAATGVRDAMLVRDETAGLWVPRPGYEAKGTNIHIKINSLGFRGSEFSRAKPPGTFRIVCLGASTTFGAESSSDDGTWPRRLEQLLQSTHPDRRIEVINAAVGGYVSDDNLKNLRHRVLALDPDLVIYYEANNEIVRDTSELAIREGLVDSEGRRQPAWSSALSRISLTFDLAYKNLAILLRSREGGHRLNSVPRTLPDRFIGVLDEMRQLLAARGVRFVLSTFIVKYRRDQDRDTQIANADVAFYYMPWMSIDGLLDAMDVYNEAIIDYGRRAGVPVVDDRAVVPPTARHFVDCMHMTDEGGRIMARRFAEFLETHDLLAARSSARSPQ